MIIGLDLGYGYVKATNGTESVSFPALAGAGRDLLGDWFGNREYDVTLVEANQSERWFVGDLARRETADAVINLTTEKHHSADTRALAYVALALLSHGEPVQIVTGLPLSQYDALRGSLQTELLSLQGAVQFHGYPREQTLVQVESVRVIPQAMGAMLAGLLDPLTLQPKDASWLEGNGNLVLVDVGTRTTGIVTFETRPKFDLVWAHSAAADMGMFQAHQMLQLAFRDLTGDAPPLEDLYFYETLWDQTEVRYKGRSWLWENKKNAVQDRFGERIARWVTQTLGPEQTAKIIAVFAAGGGAAVVEPALSRTFRQVTLVPEAQMANAIGYWLFGRARG